MLDPIVERQFGRCLYLQIPVLDDDKSIREHLQNAIQAEKFVKRLINGQLTADEYLQLMEPIVPDIDQYIDEVENNIEQEFSLILD